MKRNPAILAALVTLAVGPLVLWFLLPHRGDVSALELDEHRGLEKADRMFAVLAAGDRLLGVEDHFLYQSLDSGRTYQQLGGLPKPGDATVYERLENVVARASLTRMVRRNRGPITVASLGSGTLLVFYDRIYRSEDDGSTFQIVPGTRLGIDLPGPLNAPGSVAVSPGDTVHYGEYVIGDRPMAPRIIRGTDDGQRWEVAYQFQEGEVFHVHSVTYDRYREGHWVAAGDRGDEARLLFSDDGLRSLALVGCCTQDWRLVDPIVTPSALYWGSDDDVDRPGIFRFDPGARGLQRIRDLPNPSYSAVRLADGSMAIATTFEPGRPWSERTQNAYASVFWSRDGDQWQEILRLPGDPEAISEALRPQFLFPDGDAVPALLVNPMHTAEHDGSVLRVNPGRAASAPSSARRPAPR